MTRRPILNYELFKVTPGIGKQKHQSGDEENNVHFNHSEGKHHQNIPGPGDE